MKASETELKTLAGVKPPVAEAPVKEGTEESPEEIKAKAVADKARRAEDEAAGKKMEELAFSKLNVDEKFQGSVLRSWAKGRHREAVMTGPALPMRPGWRSALCISITASRPKPCRCFKMRAIPPPEVSGENPWLLLSPGAMPWKIPESTLVKQSPLMRRL